MISYSGAQTHGRFIKLNGITCFKKIYTDWHEKIRKKVLIFLILMKKSEKKFFNYTAENFFLLFTGYNK